MTVSWETFRGIFASGSWRRTADTLNSSLFGESRFAWAHTARPDNKILTAVGFSIVYIVHIHIQGYQMVDMGISIYELVLFGCGSDYMGIVTISKCIWWSNFVSTSLLPSKLSRSGFVSDISSKSSRLSGNKQIIVTVQNNVAPFWQKGGKHTKSVAGDSCRGKLEPLMKSPPVPNFAN